jgi:hypothetical protein
LAIPPENVLVIFATPRLCATLMLCEWRKRKMSFKYRETVINQLMNHGIKPDENTPPDCVREFINELYLYEIRALRQRLLDGFIAKSEYANAVLELRNRYPVLGLPIRFWTAE